MFKKFSLRIVSGLLAFGIVPSALANCNVNCQTAANGIKLDNDVGTEKLNANWQVVVTGIKPSNVELHKSNANWLDLATNIKSDSIEIKELEDEELEDEELEDEKPEVKWPKILKDIGFIGLMIANLLSYIPDNDRRYHLFGMENTWVRFWDILFIYDFLGSAACGIVGLISNKILNGHFCDV